MKNILITGGAGFIGSHIVNQLLKENYKVTVFDNLRKGYKNNVPSNVNLIVGDLLNIKNIEDALKEQDAVIHMASLIVVPESVEKPIDYFQNNVIGSINLLESMRKNNIKKIIFSSSAAVYGEPIMIPIPEHEIKKPISPYGAYKLAVESIISSYCHSYGFDGTCLRYFNAYGPGELHKPETHAIPNFIKAALNNELLKVTGSIEQVRDYVYVKDLARAHTLALNLKGFHTLNVGSGRGCSLKELVNTLEEVMNKKLNIINSPARPGDVMTLLADISKIKEELNWIPEYSLKEGLKETLDWFKNI